MARVEIPKAWEWVRSAASCNGCGASWTGRNALACAATHTRKTGHQTVAEITNRTTYGTAQVDHRQGALFEGEEGKP